MEKKCRKCWDTKDISHFDPDRLGKYWVASTCKTCKKEKQIKDYKPIQNKTEVKKVWKKTLTRLKEKGSETRVHIEVWRTRPHYCQNCWQPVNFFDPSCFAHILPKSRYEKWRYDPNNIALVHSVRDVKDETTGETYDCHGELDTKMAGKKLEFEKLLEEWDPEKIKDFIKNL